MIYKIEPAIPTDSRAIWEIRYHPSVNQQSLNAKPVDFAEHDRWFQDRYLNNHASKCFVLRAGDHNQVVGYCRFDAQADGNYLVSIAIHPDHQGGGLGQILLSEALRQLPTPSIISATIKKNNAPSLKLFQKNGFVISQEDSANYYLKKSDD